MNKNLSEDMLVTLNNGIKMPRLGIGVDRLKGDDVVSSVYLAIKAGYRMIDTASLYRNEKEVGKAIQMSMAEGIVKREDLFVSSKAPYFFPGRKETIDGYKESCRNLGLEYLDLYMLHHPYREYFSWQKEIVSSWEGLEDLYFSGDVKSIGVSNFSWPYFDVLFNCCKIMPVTNQLECHPQHQNIEAVLTCRERGIQVVSWSPLNRGRIVEEPLIKNLALKYNKTAAQIALRWNIQKGNALLVRSTKEERILSNNDIWNFSLSSDDMELLNQLKPDNYARGHTSDVVPIGMMPFKSYQSYFFSKDYVKKYKLFGFIPFLKIKRYNQTIKWFLFGIPILKCKFVKKEG